MFISRPLGFVTDHIPLTLVLTVALNSLAGIVGEHFPYDRKGKKSTGT